MAVRRSAEYQTEYVPRIRKLRTIVTEAAVSNKGAPVTSLRTSAAIAIAQLVKIRLLLPKNLEESHFLMNLNDTTAIGPK